MSIVSHMDADGMALASHRLEGRTCMDTARQVQEEIAKEYPGHRGVETLVTIIMANPDHDVRQRGMEELRDVLGSTNLAVRYCECKEPQTANNTTCIFCGGVLKEKVVAQ